jgi:hypothetical protein
MAIQFGVATMKLGADVIGHLQNVNLDFTFDVAELMSGNGIYPVDVRVHSGKIKGTAEFADLTAVAFEKLLGGTRTTTSVAISNSSKPSAFALECSLTTDGINFKITFNKARSTKLSLAFVRDKHLIPNFDFSIEADPTSGAVATIDVGDVS